MKRIMFVDDDMLILSLAKLMFRKLGHQGVFLDNGAEALDYLKSDQNFHLIFLDLMMPHLSGFQVLEKISENKIDIPIVVQTGLLDDGDLALAMKLGAIKCLSKPYTREEIGFHINKYAK